MASLLNGVGESPVLTTVLPISKKTVHYRAYNYRESSIMTQAYSTNDNKIIMNAFVNHLINCVEGDKELIESLTLMDADWLFIQIEIASTGEYSGLAAICGHSDSNGNPCNHKLEFAANRSEIVMNNADFDLESDIIIHTGKDSCIEMRIPTVKEYIDIIMAYNYDPDKDLKATKKEATHEDLYVYASIKSVTAKLENDIRVLTLGYSGLDNQFPIEEIEFYLECLPVSTKLDKQFSDFIESTPYLSLDIENIQCEKCKKLSKVKLVGISDFF